MGPTKGKKGLKYQVNFIEAQPSLAIVSKNFLKDFLRGFYEILKLINQKNQVSTHTFASSQR